MNYIWISNGGESCCGHKGHGGMSLAAAVEAKDYQPMPGDDGLVELVTGLDHWIGFPEGFNGDDLTCEYCDREEVAR